MTNLVFVMQMADTSLNAAYYKALKTRKTDRDCAEARKTKTNTYFLGVRWTLKGSANYQRLQGKARTRVKKKMKNDCLPTIYARLIPEIC